MFPAVVRPTQKPQASKPVLPPGETALATWVAHRCHRSPEPVFEELEQISGGGGLVGMRRGQAVLDALMCFGLPVRALRRTGT